MSKFCDHDFFFLLVILSTCKQNGGRWESSVQVHHVFCMTFYSFLFQLHKLVWLADELCVRFIILKREFGHSSKRADINVIFTDVGIRKPISLLCTLILHEQVYKYILSVKQHVQFIRNAS